MKSCLVFVVNFFLDRYPIGQIGFWCRRGSNPGFLFDNKRVYKLN